jgi:cell wall-associated NlpC family hydrolase
VVSVIAAVVLPLAHSANADQLANVRAEADQLAAQIQAQGQQLAALSEQYDQDQIRVQQLDQQAAQTQAQIARTRAQVTAAQDNLRRQAIQQYMSGGNSSGLQQLFAPSGERAAIIQEYQQVANGNISAAIDHFQQVQSVLTAQESQLQTTQTQARATLAAAQTARQGAQAALANQQATLSRVKGQIATLVAQQQAAEAAAQAAAFQARLAAQRAAANGNLASAPPAPNGGGARAVAAAETQIGVPYVWAGATPGAAFDCSGLTMWAWAQAGVALSHSAADQYSETTHVPLADLQPGDLLFYSEGGTIGHVTMYVGPGQMIQAMETGTRIMITGIWTSGLVGAGRP